jgi:4-diphosphocytidyl-2-C-methyl-D-erythritol kinase
MRIRASAAGLEVWAPAKLNLFLEVLGKRDDGFHEIETLMCPITLYDTLYFRAASASELRLECRWADARGQQTGRETLPEGPENTVMRALLLLRQRTGINAGASVQLVKRIPSAAGLAGGSSDAAAALLAANRGWAVDLSPPELHSVAAEVGSDVPFFLSRGMAVCRGRGEQIVPQPTGTPLHFVVVRPPAGLRTVDVYKACQPAKVAQNSGDLVRSLRQGRLGLAGKLLHNRLQPAAERLSDWIGRLKAEFARLDVLGHQMSGSGTSYFGLCRSARQARRVARQMEVRGVGSVYAVRSCF